jgi:tRNA(Arg) A34 adenosine deaminase TadA
MPTPTDEHWMQQAIAVAAENPSAPFGAVIIEGDTESRCAHGVNQAREDPTLHAEMVALRNRFKAPALPRATPLVLFSTAEPCPMCAAACCWAGIRRIVYGVSIPWLCKHGWPQINIRAADVCTAGSKTVELRGGVLADACAELFLRAR